MTHRSILGNIHYSSLTAHHMGFTIKCNGNISVTIFLDTYETQEIENPHT